MKLAISQPTFLPWAGYFSLIDYVDHFIFLDNVQFEKRSWQQRNYISLDKKKFLLTVPVISKGKRFQNINEVLILKENLDKILKTIFHAYKKSKFFENYFYEIDKIFRNNNKILNLNCELIKYFIKQLSIDTEINYQTKIQINSKKENLIFDICKKVKCKEYISTIGSKIYLEKYENIPNSNIKINYFTYDNNHYSLKKNYFINKLSIIDLLFNKGPQSLEIIRQGFKLLKNNEEI